MRLVMEERAKVFPLPSRTAQKDDVAQPLALEFTNPPSPLLIEPIVRTALAEDLGRAGDITTDNIIPAGETAHAVIAAREAGVVSGLIAADLAFKLMNAEVRLTPRAPDGSEVTSGSVIAELEGPARAILTGERVALNFIVHLSGVATATQRLVKSVAGTKARIICTRKTIPGIRVLQKYAVRCGGGLNHRFGLDDAVLIKDNHIAAAGGVAASIRALRGRLGPMVKIEVEVDTLAQLEEALAAGAEAILLDNMPPEMMKRAVAITNGRTTLEASGGVTLERVRAIAESGVDFISSGALTHSARAMDVGLDFI
jgi:nicotinate-nucleotide pyrophosphorylase (carboxylating)